MRSRRTLLSVVVLTLAAGGAWAGDVRGTWVAEFTIPSGETRESKFTFEVDGEELTGTVSGRSGDAPIDEGRIAGDEISFSVTRDFGRGEMRFLYEGTVSGDEIELTVTIEDRDRTFEMTAKRAE